MAGMTHGWRLAEFFTRLVATLALHLLRKVAALQFVVGEFVVELLVVEFSSLEITAFVFCVTFLTFFAGVDTTVIALLLANVFAHILVAIHTQIRLRLLVEFLMA